MDERLSLTASDLSGRLAVNCCVNSMTTVDVVSGDASWLTVSEDEDASSEWALEPGETIKINVKKHEGEGRKRSIVGETQ